MRISTQEIDGRCRYLLLGRPCCVPLESELGVAPLFAADALDDRVARWLGLPAPGDAAQLLPPLLVLLLCVEPLKLDRPAA